MKGPFRQHQGVTGQATSAPLGDGRFEVRQTLGEGAYGVVYDAFDAERGERVAVKALTHFGPRALSDFKTEFRALADLSHPNLVQLHELIEAHGSWLIVMELVEGVSLESYVRADRPTVANANAQPFHEERLRATFRQLAEGLQALHAAGLVHRDLKPPNLRVTSSGRLVLLDFGLVAEVPQGDSHVTESIVGSAAYMAPEQALGAVGPPADWYAAGCILYEALTGQLPFVGSTTEVLLAKQRKDPLPPREVRPEVPSDLNELCVALLARDPDNRARADRVREHCRYAASERHSLASISTRTDFAGREQELSRLEAAFERSMQGKFCSVVIEGESGMGKSALVRELLNRLQIRRPETLVLRGRCYELEAAAYKGLDGIVDALCRALLRQPRELVQALMPRRAWLLPQLFPVMETLGAVLPATREAQLSRDPSVRRRAALEALFELLERIARDRPLVLALDDLQWADLETLRVIQDLGELSPLPGTLWLLSCRLQAEREPPVQRAVECLAEREDSQVLRLKGLPAPEARQLAAQLLGPELHHQWVQPVAEHAHGHPLLVEELASYVRQHEPRADELTLEHALSRRVGALKSRTRELLELVALAGSPRPLPLLADAMGVAPEELSSSVGELRAERLVVSGQNGRVRCFHDRLRHGLVASMKPELQRKRHGQLARAFELDAQADRADAALHWEHAGQPERALPLLEQAGMQAQQGLAFDMAAALFAMVLDRLSDKQGQDFARVCALRADALSATGRNLEAGRAYLVAAELAGTSRGVELRRRAAQHLLQAGELEDGVQVLKGVLKDLNLDLPGGPKAAFLKLVWHRTVIGMRGLERPIRDASEIAPETLQRLAVLHGVSPALTWIDIFRGSELGARHLREALASGERSHTVMALAAEGLLHSLQPADVSEQAHQLLDRAQALAEDVESPASRAMVHMCRGQALQAQWRAKAACAELAIAERLFSAEARVDWHQTMARTFTLSLLGLRGRYDEHGECIERWLTEARARDDRFAFSNYVLMGLACYRHLIRDRPEEARIEVAQAVSLWPADHLGMPQFGAFYAVGAMVSYCEDWQSALAFNQEKLPDILRSPLAFPRFVRASLLLVHALVCIGAACEVQGAQRKAHLKEALQCVRRVRKTHVPTSQLLGLIEGQVALLDGDHEAAAVHLDQVTPRLNALGVTQWARQVALARAFCSGREQGLAQLQQEADWLAGQGFRNVERAVRWLYPVGHAGT